MKKYLLIFIECINLPRFLILYLFINISNSRNDVIKDMDRISYKFIEVSWEKLSYFKKLLICSSLDKIFRNIIYYRLLKYNKQSAYLFRVLYSIRNDIEIWSIDNIGSGLTIFHGYGTIVNCQSAGDNLSVWQGVTIGKKGGVDSSEKLPTIGNNVQIYSNAVVVGDITIGDNVRIGANCVVTKDVPANHTVYGNPCKFVRQK
ncbi:serine acetyltransferase [Streptococcus suis]|uniref:Cps25K n=1 Tax=Streptococcus suis TaxID=1307 RepID=G8DUB8_STRSU|nr:serine acetyltransferase [Streptococcus suis]AEH57619.1 Cps25K [Streptococcus suis]NQM09709.1 serine acetyltransferase [Streptococcus suis]NQO93636.1 serine acetyltransferase [Streptococcus suis]CYU55492.1 exopolysaccharide biosynthesis protein [Streptococcus suis]HEM3169777.1 serine acetyltransferase [Streptococcus suis 89-3576-3]